MRRLGDVAMSGAERSRRWRLKRKLRLLGERVTSSMAQLPLWVEPEEARPIVEAWHGRGLEYPITQAQWSTLDPLELEDEAKRAAIVKAIVEGPRAPAPAFAVWGAALARLQALRVALRKVLTPRAVAYAAPPEGPGPEPMEGLEGVEGFRELGRKLFGRDPCGCVCHRSAGSRCSSCTARHAGDPRATPPRARAIERPSYTSRRRR